MYAIDVSGFTDLAGNTDQRPERQRRCVLRHLRATPDPANSTPLGVTGVTAENGSVIINNNIIPQPDTIAIAFNKPLSITSANNNTVHLLAKIGNNYTVVASSAAYNPGTDSIYLTPRSYSISNARPRSISTFPGAFPCWCWPRSAPGGFHSMAGWTRKAS